MFTGRAEPRLIKGPRYSIPFHTVSSEKFTKTEQDLKAYDAPISKIFTQSMADEEDRRFLAEILGWCRHCFFPEDQHVFGKCLFDNTMYEPFGAKKAS
jgi:hypothetical protein